MATFFRIAGALSWLTILSFTSAVDVDIDATQYVTAIITAKIQTVTRVVIAIPLCYFRALTTT
jgi:hypothetical protein